MMSKFRVITWPCGRNIRTKKSRSTSGKISVVAIVFTKTEVDQPREMPRTPANLTNDCKDFS